MKPLLGTCACSDAVELENLKNRTLTAFDLARTLPDMYWALLEIGIQPLLCRGTFRRELVFHKETKPDSPNKYSSVTEFNLAGLDGLTPQDKENLLKHHIRRGSKFKITQDFGSNLILTARFENKTDTPSELTYYPDVVDDVNGKLFYILDPDSYIPETAAYLALLYSFGMLARYSPDLWMRSLENSVKFSELVDTLLTSTERKFPNLILDQMLGVKHLLHV